MFAKRCSSPLGEITLLSDGIALNALFFEGQKTAPVVIPSDAPNGGARAIFDETERWLDAYFSASPLPEAPPLSPFGTPFQKAVWEALRSIPYGETTTYSRLASTLRARGISASPRAVGGAVGHNPILLLIPCHRVIGYDGSLTGYAGGLDRKRFLLEWEHEHR